MDRARTALQAYGYKKEGRTWFHGSKRYRSQAWEETDTGFRRLDPENGVFHPTPYVIKDEFQKAAGLNFRLQEHAQCFVWEWPPDEVATIYETAWHQLRHYNEEYERRKGRPAEVAPEIVEANQDVVVIGDAATEEPPRRGWFGRRRDKGGD